MIYILEVIILVFLFIFAAFTAASEIALIAASRLKLKKMASDGSKAAKAVLKILETPERFLGTILVTNNVVETLIAAMVTAIVISFWGDRGRSVLFATFVAAFLIIVCEVTAKTLAARHSEKMSAYLALPVQALIYVLSPIVRILAVITNFIVTAIGSHAKGKPALVTEEEMRAILKIGQEEGVLQKEKFKMLSNVFDFSNVIVQDVMTPKEKIFAIDMSSSLDDILEKVLESGYSRIPIFKGSLSNIVGIINMKDLLSLSMNKGLVVLQDILYPAIFVPKTRKVTELLREFQKGHTHLAIVVDEKRDVEGIITLEDLLEEIVGEIEDEYDVRTNLIK